MRMMRVNMSKDDEEKEGDDKIGRTSGAVIGGVVGTKVGSPLIGAKVGEEVGGLTEKEARKVIREREEKKRESANSPNCKYYDMLIEDIYDNVRDRLIEEDMSMKFIKRNLVELIIEKSYNTIEDIDVISEFSILMKCSRSEPDPDIWKKTILEGWFDEWIEKEHKNVIFSILLSVIYQDVEEEIYHFLQSYEEDVY